MSDEYVIVDKIKWWVFSGTAIPYCPVHHIRLWPIIDHYSTKYNFIKISHTLRCVDCNNNYVLPRSIQSEKIYVQDRTDAKIIKGQKFINLDDEALPIAEHKSKNSEYFVTSLLTQSKIGLRLVVYAGKKGSNQKTQIFVEPEIKRLAFDQNDLHPSDVFTKVEATFIDNTKAIVEKSKP